VELELVIGHIRAFFNMFLELLMSIEYINNLLPGYYISEC